MIRSITGIKSDAETMCNKLNSSWIYNKYHMFNSLISQNSRECKNKKINWKQSKQINKNQIFFIHFFSQLLKYKTKVN